MIHATEKDVGRPVVYHPTHGEPERGVISSIGQEFVFVRYGDDAAGRATTPGFLEWDDVPARKTAMDRDDYRKMGSTNLKARLEQVEGLRAEHMEAALQDAFAVQEITAVLAERGEL